MITYVLVASLLSFTWPPTVEVPAHWLISGDARLRARGGELLVKAGDDGGFVLMAALADRDASVRVEALDRLAQLDQMPAPALDTASAPAPRWNR